ncbi:MAG: DUF4783 domain-containing protein [Rhodothermales bacterium]
MNVRFCISIGVLCCALLPARAQDSNQVLQEFRAAVLQADAAALARQAAPTVEIALFGESKRYSRSQATLLLRTFFSDWPPDTFRLVDFTKTTSGWFLEGHYATVAGDELRFYVRMRLTDGRWLIRELLIEEYTDVRD